VVELLTQIVPTFKPTRLPRVGGDSLLTGDRESGSSLSGLTW